MIQLSPQEKVNLFQTRLNHLTNIYYAIEQHKAGQHVYPVPSYSSSADPQQSLEELRVLWAEMDVEFTGIIAEYKQTDFNHGKAPPMPLTGVVGEGLGCCQGY